MDGRIVGSASMELNKPGHWVAAIRRVADHLVRLATDRTGMGRGNAIHLVTAAAMRSDLGRT